MECLLYTLGVLCLGLAVAFEFVYIDRRRKNKPIEKERRVLYKENENE